MMYKPNWEQENQREYQPVPLQDRPVDEYEFFEDQLRKQKNIQEQKDKISSFVQRHNKKVKRKYEQRVEEYLEKNPDISVGYDYDGALLASRPIKLKSIPLVRQLKTTLVDQQVNILPKIVQEVLPVTIIEDEVKKLFEPQKLITDTKTKSSFITNQTSLGTEPREQHNQFQIQRGVKLIQGDVVITSEKKPFKPKLGDRITKQEYEKLKDQPPAKKYNAEDRRLKSATVRRQPGADIIVVSNPMMMNFSESTDTFSDLVVPKSFIAQQTVFVDKIRVPNQELLGKLLD